MLREAIRLKRTTPDHFTGPASLLQVSRRCARLQLHRCRSDAEAHAVEVIDAARLPLPDVNVRRAGEEADLSWPACRLIVEIDGDQFHQDKAEDARKTAIWQAAGWRVRRAPSGLVFDEPERFAAGVRQHLAAN